MSEKGTWGKEGRTSVVLVQQQSGEEEKGTRLGVGEREGRLSQDICGFSLQAPQQFR